MDPMVSARVPAEIRDQVNVMLKDIGSSPTELINSAYVAFLSSGKLPRKSSGIKPGRKTVSGDMLADLMASIRQTTFEVPDDAFAGRSYDNMLEQRLKDEYEALA